MIIIKIHLALDIYVLWLCCCCCCCIIIHKKRLNKTEWNAARLEIYCWWKTQYFVTIFHSLCLLHVTDLLNERLIKTLVNEYRAGCRWASYNCTQISCSANIRILAYLIAISTDHSGSHSQTANLNHNNYFWWEKTSKSKHSYFTYKQWQLSVSARANQQQMK